MVLGQALQNKWEFRNKDHVHSSEDEPDSTSSAEPVFKKLKQISDLMSTKSRRSSSISNSRTRKGKGMQITKSKKDGSDSYRRTTERSLHGDRVQDEKGRISEPLTLDSNLLYMRSILEELRVARENVILWMREEVQKLMANPSPDIIAEEDLYGAVSMSDIHLPFP
ncbi:hypothetical protein M6B38_300490 [Iris pallida]|uniref:Uncharacterized protein n=1 Tax=Iris pallida TaxID=29817 RepID=A0AAX6HPZ1_IRIPA|nr:hypothetical protein M6B38_167285 [Iris pallida]KAJ6843159.1 hypothetical protein M6B38_300490 [Iris pallida]